MRDFNSLSGPWVGLSVQDGLRISEAIRLTIRAGRIEGDGTDQDGRFTLDGTYDAATQAVRLRRVYTWTTEPSQMGAGLPYRYAGIWDGAMVAGRWSAWNDPWMGGPFEMWPDREEDREELTIRFEELTSVG